MKTVGLKDRLKVSASRSLDVHLVSVSLVLLSASYVSPWRIVVLLPILFYLFYAIRKAPTTLVYVFLPLQLIALLSWALSIRPLVSCLLVQLPSTLVAFALLPLPRIANTPSITLVLDEHAPNAASPLSLLGGWKGHVAWCALARRTGTSPQQLQRSVREDTHFSWGLKQLKLSAKVKEMNKEPNHGQVLRSWNRVFVWDEDCVPLGVLESWRTLSDTPADEAMQLLCTLPAGGDALARLASAHADASLALPVASRTTLKRFFQVVDTLPPRGAGAISAEWYISRGRKRELLCFPHAFDEVKETVKKLEVSEQVEQVELDDEEMEEMRRVLREGQAVFYRYGPPILLSLLHMGLAGGFASPRISNVLSATGYLLPRASQANAECKAERKEATREHRPDQSGPTAAATAGVEGVSQRSADRSFRRLLETTSWLLDVMESLDGLMPPSACLISPDASMASLPGPLTTGGSGWASTLRVRLLHASVRNRLASKSAYDATSDGVAINQEDLLATLCAFAVVPLWSLQRMGLSPSAAEREAYIATWRHVGFYTGISPILLARCFGSAALAERFFASTASHHFITQPRLLKAPPALRNGHVPQGPLKGPALPLLHAVAGRPPGNMSFAAHLALARFLIGPDLSTALHIPSASKWRFFRLRTAIFLLALPPLFAHYYPRRAWANALSVNCKALLRRITQWSINNTTESLGTAAGLDVEVTKLDPEEGKHIVRQYRSLMMEMGVVLLGLTLGVLGGLGNIGWLLWTRQDFEAGLEIGAVALLFFMWCVIA